ncbi:MAG TPA: ABC transporter permease [Edaphobacter sp.]|jgi:putative ABC transport system permease protein
MQIADTKETITMALDTLRANKLRSGLTILGIVIGVMTVIIISSVINGLNSRVSGLVESLGTNVIWVFRFEPIGRRLTTEELTRKQLTYDDAMAMKELPHVEAVSPGLQYRDQRGVEGTVAVKYGTKKMEGTTLEGDAASVKDVYDLNMKEGRFFTDGDTERAANVVVLGNDTADGLFGTESPVGQDVTIAGMVFTVVGVMDKQKQAFGGGKNPEDNKAFFPVTTFHKIHPEVLDYWISLKFDDQKNKALVQDELTDLLRRRRKVKNEAPDNFAIFGTDSLTRLWDQITFGLFALMLSLSAVGLLVGGVGVMNIMLVSVTERTREIGVRKAIGANKQTILTQFTLEAMTLCAVGGIIGVLGGSAIGFAVHFFFPAALSAVWICAAFLSSCGIGLIFGIYPAWKAANLNPIEALRYE